VIAPSVSTAPRPSVAASLFRALRPAQWTKNLVVFAALLFGEQLFAPAAAAAALVAFVTFCGLSGAVYLVNDVRDREADREHPVKRLRPVAAGDLPVPVALGAATCIAAASLSAAVWLGAAFFAHAVGYLALQGAYSFGLKRQVILDVLAIALGFVVRASAGGAAIDVEVSQWLLMCTILLALFLALAKRRHEITLLGDAALTHRAILGEYTPYLVDQMISVVTASTLMAYAFYTVSPETAERFGTPWLGLTIPFPLYGIFRYLYLVHRRSQGGSPTELLLADRPLLLCVALWALAVAGIIYAPVF
jgi:4-hydroxybenzoate polyprenyltransferase